MNIFEKFLDFITYRVETAPESYGPLHLFMLLLVIGFTVLLCILFKDASARRFRRILFVLWCILVVGELYHQTCFFFDVEGGVAVWEYQWYKFPFQFCATPLYILPLAIFPKSERLRSCALAFMSTFSLFAGLAVIIYPNDVFTTIIGASVQSLIHHGLQVVIGITIATHERKRFNTRFFLGGVPIFIILITLAMIMNVVGYHLLQGAGMDDTFNMFYVSPYFDCTLPVLSDLYPILPYPVFLIVYILGFVGVAALVFYIQKLFIDFKDISSAIVAKFNSVKDLGYAKK